MNRLPRQMPSQEHTHVGLRMPADRKRKIQAAATAEKVSLSCWIENAIDAALDRQADKETAVIDNDLLHQCVVNAAMALNYGASGQQILQAIRSGASEANLTDDGTARSAWLRTLCFSARIAAHKDVAELAMTRTVIAWMHKLNLVKEAECLQLLKIEPVVFRALIEIACEKNG